ncbi:MAG: hypothetical protein PF508_11865, partial [Spirochaeta sp.]|nr:hypothetical protein [Spirochaeta sp.]
MALYPGAQRFYLRLYLREGDGVALGEVFDAVGEAAGDLLNLPVERRGDCREPRLQHHEAFFDIQRDV